MLGEQPLVQLEQAIETTQEFARVRSGFAHGLPLFDSRQARLERCGTRLLSRSVRTCPTEFFAQTKRIVMLRSTANQGTAEHQHRQGCPPKTTPASHRQSRLARPRR